MALFRKPFFWTFLLVILPAGFLGGYALAPFVLGKPKAPTTPLTSAEASPPRQPIAVESSGPAVPRALVETLGALSQSFDGEVGIAVQSIDKGWVASVNGARPFPQQSVSKLWVAATVLDNVDRGKASLAEAITLTQNDLTIFHQPIRKNILAGVYQPAISELLFFALTQSDNTANEALFKRAGGKAGVEGFLRRAALSGITMAQSEIALQMGIAGTQWNPAFSYGRSFWTARDAVPWDDRKAAIEAYVRNPTDGATPVAVAAGLAKLKQGKLLSARSTAYLLDLMAQSKTGPERLKSGLAPGWSLAHKTGTGQVLQMQYNEHAGIFTAYNDVGILTSPQVKHYAVVVMIGRTMQSVPTRQALMRAVTQAVIGCEATGQGTC